MGYEATESQLKANLSGIFLRILLLEAQISRPYHWKFNFVLNPFKNISLSERNLVKSPWQPLLGCFADYSEQATGSCHAQVSSYVYHKVPYI